MEQPSSFTKYGKTVSVYVLKKGNPQNLVKVSVCNFSINGKVTQIGRVVILPQIYTWKLLSFLKTTFGNVL